MSMQNVDVNSKFALGALLRCTAAGEPRVRCIFQIRRHRI